MELLITGAYQCSQIQLDKIASLGYKVTFIQDERIKLDIDVSKFQVIICNSLFLYNDIAKFSNLKMIQLTSVGLDRVPNDYIFDHNIEIYNARGVYSIPMAEWAILKILELYKDTNHFHHAQYTKNWNKKRDLYELYGKKACVLGIGNVGLEVAKRLKAFGVYVIGVDLFSHGQEYVDEVYHIKQIDTAISQGDIIVITLPLTEETKHLLNAERLTLLKDNAVIVNIARGAIIDENALINAMISGKLLGAALDVFEQEPLAKESELWEMHNVLITPHNSFISHSNNERLNNMIYTNLEEWIKKN